MIALTANTVIGERETFLKEGFNDYLSKPIEPEDESIAEISKKDEKNPAYDIELLKASDVDVAAGLNYCANDQSFYFEMLDNFTSSCENKVEELDYFYNSKDWYEYEVKVHALKSNLRMISFNAAYEQARALEEAADHKDIGYIKENHTQFLKAVRDTGKLIREAKEQG